MAILRASVAVIGFAAAAWAAAAVAQLPPAGEPLATRGGWEAGAQVARYRYEEPGLMHLAGDRIGAAGSYTATGDTGFHARVEMRFSYGELDYQGSGTLYNVPDQLFELRALAGKDHRAGDLVWSPYIGAGYRHLYNDLRGITSTGAVGYRRYSEYFYLPLGVTMRVRLDEAWVLAPQFEYDILIRGRQRSTFSDTGLGFNDVPNKQRNGSGYRLQLMFERGNLAFGPWLHYWDIKDSDRQPIGLGFVGWEPANWTRELGLELRYRF